MNLAKYAIFRLIISRERRQHKERRLKDESGRATLDLNQYHSYEDMVKWIKRLQHDYPGFVRAMTIGKSRENRTIYAVEVIFWPKLEIFKSVVFFKFVLKLTILKFSKLRSAPQTCPSECFISTVEYMLENGAPHIQLYILFTR